MTKILNVNDLCDAIAASTLDDVTQRALIDALETSVAHVAKVLAGHYGTISEHAEYEGGFGGLCVNFRPACEGQECPDVIDEGDEGGDWIADVAKSAPSCSMPLLTGISVASAVPLQNAPIESATLNRKWLATVPPTQTIATTKSRGKTWRFPARMTN
ncbi:hypothetical protein CO683_39150 [Bradyrhizobium ottawaense]|uniref:hypothetical protein n=1 Tax=Bradyrhizobium ottawaense TaxID=931866 RepID=UPI000BE7C9DA|nr:hypothetical protein [Bradyrhizobium ottawaense]PDT64275.1 hypothetical protein CO683_39150 [Bradyrhizobium ottawaense]